MSIALVTSGTGSNSAIDGGNFSLTFPSMLPNDVVYVALCGRGSSTSPSISSSGWGSPIVNLEFEAASWLRVYRKFMSETPDASADITGTASASNAAVAAFICLRGVNSTTPGDDVTPTTATASATTNPDPPSITTQTANAWVLVVAGSDINDASVTQPTGYSNHAGTSASDSNSASVRLATKLVAVAGAENPGSWTNWSSGAWGTISIAIRAANPAGQGLLMCGTF